MYDTVTAKTPHVYISDRLNTDADRTQELDKWECIGT